MTPHDPDSPFAPIPEAIEAIRAGEMIIVVDDEDRENEGDLVVAAEKVTPDVINYMARYARGLICLALTEERCDALELPLMVRNNDSPFETAFTVSIEARGKVTTGISAADRAATVLTAIDAETRASDLARPGHIFPLRSCRGGVLKRTGHTEASVDLASLAGLYPAGVVCEIMNEDGSMARVDDLVPYAKEHGLLMITVSELIQYRLRTETLVERCASPRIPTMYGEFTVHGYQSRVTGEKHIALVRGEIESEEPTLVRVHSQDLIGDVFGSSLGDSGGQLHTALEKIHHEGRGVLLYLLQEGRGIGLFNRLQALELQEKGHDTVEANERLGFKPDQRDYGVGAQILRDLGVRKMRLMTNNPSKYVALSGYGLEIVDRVALELPPSDESRSYLETKREKLGHILKFV